MRPFRKRERTKSLKPSRKCLPMQRCAAPQYINAILCSALLCTPSDGPVDLLTACPFAFYAVGPQGKGEGTISHWR